MKKHDRVFNAVFWFARQMLAKLWENKTKDGWHNKENHWLFEQLEKEVEELKWSWDSPGDKIRECADIANFAMMIADNYRESRL